MSKEWFSKASRVQDFSSTYVGSKMDTNVVVLHSTEGTSWPGYSGGATAPNMTIKPDFANKKVEWRQHYASNRSSRALENRSGGVETNTLNAFQIELVGTCDPNTHAKWKNAGVQHIYMPEAPDWFLAGIAEVLNWLKDNYSKFVIKDAAPRGWVGPEKSPARLDAPQRMTFKEWNNAYGVVAHQHVPENGHWDTGAFPIAKLIAIATGDTEPEIPEPTEPQVYDKMDPASYFIGVHGDHVTWLGNQVVKHLNVLDIKPPYLIGPGPDFSETDVAAVKLFQEAQGWSGADADGMPGPETLKRLAVDPVDSPETEPEEPSEPEVPETVDYLNPKNYPPNGPTHGPQIKWLGERLVVHGFGKHYQVGPSEDWGEADRLNVQDFQKAQDWTGSGADGYPGAETLKRLNAAPAPKPTPSGTKVTTRSQNVAGYNAPDKPGVKNYKTNIPAIAKEFLDSGCDISCFQELSADGPDMRPLMDKNLHSTQSRAPGGSDGRYIYRVRTETVYVAGGKFETPVKYRYNGDTKQAAWMVYTKDGIRAMDVSVHTENQGSSSVKVNQTLNFLDQAIATAKKYSVKLENVMLIGDFNEDTAVVSAMKKRGWKSVGDGKNTFTQWRKYQPFKRMDHAFVLNSVKATGRTIKCSHSDHYPIEVERELTK